MLCCCSCCLVTVSDSFVTQWTVACQASRSMWFSREEYWSRLSFPSPGHFSAPGSKPCLLHWQRDPLPLSYPAVSTWLVTRSDSQVIVWRTGFFPGSLGFLASGINKSCDSSSFCGSRMWNFIFSQKHLWNSLLQNGSSSAEGASGGSQCGWLGLLHSVHYNLHILNSMKPLRCKVHLPCTRSSFNSLSWSLVFCSSWR